MNAAQLKSKSMTLENTASSVFLLKNPSHANAAPHAKAERRSSLPSRVEIPAISLIPKDQWSGLPIDKIAKLTY